MPMTIAYLGDGGIIARGEGVVTSNEIKEVNDIIYEFPDKIKQISYQIIDLTKVTDVIISSSEVKELSNQDKKAFEINTTMFIAVVGEKDLVFGLSRMWQEFSYNSQIETQVFREMEEAQQWIRERLQKRNPDQQLNKD